jgi:hypothetical protein
VNIVTCEAHSLSLLSRRRRISQTLLLFRVFSELWCDLSERPNVCVFSELYTDLSERPNSSGVFSECKTDLSERPNTSGVFSELCFNLSERPSDGFRVLDSTRMPLTGAAAGTGGRIRNRRQEQKQEPRRSLDRNRSNRSVNKEQNGVVV